MKYMGSKARLAKDILPIILKDRKVNQWYVEPFVGGANLIDKVTGNRIGSDINPYLIACLKKIQHSLELLPKNNTETNETEYKIIKEYMDDFPDWLVGYFGFSLSFGAMFFNSWRRDNLGIRDYVKEAYRNAQKQQPLLKGINFFNKSYLELDIPANSLIYCDPPYSNTTGYKNKEQFNHEIFWEWCRNKVKEGHQVFISEYVAPADFICVFEKEICSSLTKNTGAKKAIDKLFVWNSKE